MGLGLGSAQSVTSQDVHEIVTHHCHHCSPAEHWGWAATELSLGLGTNLPRDWILKPLEGAIPWGGYSSVSL